MTMIYSIDGVTALTQHPIIEYVGLVWVVFAVIAFILAISFFHGAFVL